MDERSLVHFADNPEHLLRAYVESKEGIDRAGGFAVQVFHTLLLKTGHCLISATGSGRCLDPESGRRLQ